MNKFTVCFSNAIESTPIHELGHVLGLPHTFYGNEDAGAKYTYEDGKKLSIKWIILWITVSGLSLHCPAPLSL